MTPEVATARVVAAFQTHAEATDSFREAAGAWFAARSIHLGLPTSAAEVDIVVRRIVAADWLAKAVRTTRPGGKLDARAFAGAVEFFWSNTPLCTEVDPPVDQADPTLSLDQHAPN